MKKRRLFLYWILLECAVSLAVAAMYLTGGNLSQFYNDYRVANGIEYDVLQYEPARYDVMQYALIALGCFLVLSVLSFLLRKQIKKIFCHADNLLRKWVYFFESQVDVILEHIKRAKVNDGYYAAVRSILIVLILWLGYLAHMAGARRNYGYTIIFLLTALYALVAWMPPKRKCGHKVNGVKAAFIFLCILQFVSDVIIQKKTGFVELWMLAGFGVLYRAWERMEAPEKLWDDFAKAIETLYIFTIFYSIFIEPWWESTGIYYCGMWKNPNPFSVMIVLFILVMLYRIFQIFSKKRQYWRIILYGGGIAYGVKLILLAQCRTALLSCLVLLSWALLFAFGRKIKNIKISAVGVITMLAMVFLVVCPLLVFKGGMLFSKKMGSVTVDDMTSGRLSIWEEYISQINLWGHEGDAVVEGLPAYAHNMILEMTHTYGIFAGIIMIILLIEVVRRAFLYWEKERRNEVSFLVMGVVLVYIVSAMIESVDDLPVVWQIWDAFYLTIGFLMIQDEKAG